ncbi:MAG: CHAT domain-containing protein [Planctomycetota bacterium]
MIRLLLSAILLAGTVAARHDDELTRLLAELPEPEASELSSLRALPEDKERLEAELRRGLETTRRLASRTADFERRARLRAIAAVLTDRLGFEESAARERYLQLGELRSLGQLQNALDIAEHTLAEYPRLDRMQPYLVLARAELLRQLGRSREALAAIEGLPVDLDERVDGEKLAWSFEVLEGKCLLDLGLVDRAAPVIRRCWERALALGDDPGELAVNVVESHQVAVLASLAVADHERVLERVGELMEHPLYEAGSRFESEGLHLRILRAEARLELDATNPEVLEEIAQEIEEILPRLERPQIRIDAVLTLARVALSLERHDRALELLRSVDVISSGDQGDAPFDVACRRLALECELTLLRADVSSARALTRRIESVFDRLVTDWRAAPQREGGLGLLLYGSRRQLLVAAHEIAVLASGERAGIEATLTRLLRIEELSQLAQSLVDSPVDLTAIREEALAEGDGVLIYLPASPRSLVICLDRDRVTQERLPAYPAIRAALREYRAHLSLGLDLRDTESREWAGSEERRLARVLGERLLPVSVQQRIRSWKRLTIVGGDAIGDVPFEWLPCGDTPYLGLEWPLTHWPSLTVGAGLERASRDKHLPTTDLVLLADPVPGAHARSRWTGLDPIPLTRDLIGTLESLYARSDQLLGDGATLERLRRVDLDRVRIFQVITHGVVDPERERSIGLLLTSDGDGHDALWADDIEHLGAPRCVLLTACRSALGPMRRGDAHAADLTGAWLSRGTGVVLTAGANLRSSVAQRFSERFHAALDPGTSPAEALLQARRAAFEEHGAMLPFIDGQLRLVGAGHRPLWKPGEAWQRPTPRWPWLGIALVIALLGVTGWMLRRQRGH